MMKDRKHMTLKFLNFIDLVKTIAIWQVTIKYIHELVTEADHTIMSINICDCLLSETQVCLQKFSGLPQPMDCCQSLFHKSVFFLLWFNYQNMTDVYYKPENNILDPTNEPSNSRALEWLYLISARALTVRQNDSGRTLVTLAHLN